MRKQTLRKRYLAAKGAQFSNQEAQIIGKRLDYLAEINDIQITPKDIVNDARMNKSPLHKFFEWNESKAAEKYRLCQARNLINHIELVIIHDGKEVKSRAFPNVIVAYDVDYQEKGYIPLEKVLSEQDLRKQVLEDALREIDYWQQKYEIYRELTPIFLGIKKVEKKLSKK